MWDAFFARRQFYNKCKSGVRMISMRMEIIMKKRIAMQQFLKNDVADLLKANLSHNAYKKAQELYIEQNLSWCYNYVQECCTVLTDKLAVMQTESECPEECRVAVASLAYAAARFADLPELRDLRSLFLDKYGYALDPFVNQELVEKLKSNPPTPEVTFQLMKDVANEFTIPWDPAYTQQDRFTRGYKSYNTMPNENGITRNESTGRQRVVYEHTITPMSNATGYRERDPQRPFATNIVHAPYVILKKDDGGLARIIRNLEDKDAKKDEKSDLPYAPVLGHPYEERCRCPSTFGFNRSGSMYLTHPKLPDFDQLKSRIEALTKM